MIGTEQAFLDWSTSRQFDFTALAATNLEVALNAATGALEALTHRRLTPLAAQTLTTYGHGGDLLLLPEEMTAVTAVTLDDVAWSSDNWYAEPIGLTPLVALRGKYAAQWPAYVKIIITGTLGYKNPLPDDLLEACYLLAADMLQAGQAGVRQVNVADVSTGFDATELGRRVKELVGPHVRAM